MFTVKNTPIKTNEDLALVPGTETLASIEPIKVGMELGKVIFSNMNQLSPVELLLIAQGTAAKISDFETAQIVQDVAIGFVLTASELFKGINSRSGGQNE